MKFKIIIVFSLFLSLFTGFFFSQFNNNDLNINIEENIKIEEDEQFAKYEENSISSQEFIDDLRNVPQDGVYELQSNVDFSDSENDDITGLSLEHMFIDGNGYTLYNRDATAVFDTTTFDVTEEHDGIKYYSFFQEIYDVTIADLNFDNFMFPFGNINHVFLYNVNIFNTTYQNLIFNIYSSNISDSFSYKLNDWTVNIATIGLIMNNFDGSIWIASYFDHINFIDNQINLYDQNVTPVISLIGSAKLQTQGDDWWHGNWEAHPENIFDTIYINNITFANNEFNIKNSNQDHFLLENPSDHFYGIFYNPFIGCLINDYDLDFQLRTNIYFHSIIFNDINVYDNINNSESYTSYSILPAINNSVTIHGENIYLFNLNFDIMNAINEKEKIEVGLLFVNDAFYTFLNLDYSGFYQNELIDPSIYVNFIFLKKYSNDTEMIYQINQNNAGDEDLLDIWYYGKVESEQDYSLILPEKPTMVCGGGNLYQLNSNDDTTSVRFYLKKGFIDYRDEDYFEYTINLIDGTSNEIIWTDQAYPRHTSFLIDINLDLMYQNNLYFQVSDDEKIWEPQYLDFREFFPELYDVNSSVDNNILTISYQIYDPYQLTRFIDISLYNKDNLKLEIEEIDYTLSSNQNQIEENEITFDTEITDDFNNYYLIFEVYCGIYFLSINFSPQSVDPDSVAKLNDQFIKYSNDNDIIFLLESIYPDDLNLFPIWAIILISLAFFLFIVFIILICYFLIKKKLKDKKI
ncbi:MAG: hypothetical protein HPPSJP_4990 [Candidatus Hepatoplasma scabrum]|nr:MAG: hypothetical protein HPPSJP_4990 [Candidatus Hepatoplasma sp.]